MKNIFLLSFFFSLFFVSQSSAQWWVQGGNLLWPYGDVTIEKDLNVNGTITNDGVRPYKIYTVAFYQAEDTGIPNAIVLENTIGDIVISQPTENLAIYRFTLAGAFPSNKTFFFITQSNMTIFTGMDAMGFAMVRNSSGDYCTLTTKLGSSTAPVYVLNPLMVEIRVYP